MRFAILGLAAAAAFGQNTRVFPLTQNESSEQLQQIAVLLRAVAEAPRVSVDATQRAVTVEGTAVEIATAGWLVRQLDVPANTLPAGVHEYRPPASGDDLVRVFYIRNAPAPQALQQIATNVRSVADVPRLFVYNPLNAVAARGTSGQIALAAWLVAQLDQPANAPAASPQEFSIPGGEVARVFPLANVRNPQPLQELVTLIRALADMPRIFMYTGRWTIALRGPAERVALAAWLVSELDKPAVPAAGVAHEYRLETGPDTQVRIFFLAGQSMQSRQELAVQVRRTAQIPRLFVYNALGALAVRGTVGQVGTAERVLEERHAQ